MASFGETLRRERELREISLRDIADATKINIRYLEALEHNRFEILPGGVFNKGFIRAYARFIGADGEALVDGYLQEMAAREAAAAGATLTPAHPGLLRPAETPMRRSTDARPSEHQAVPAPVARAGVVLAEAGPGGGGAAVIPLLGGAIGGSANAAATASLDLEAPAISTSRRLMPVMTIVGAAAVLLVLVVGARSFRESPAREERPPETPAVVADAAAPQEEASSLPAQDEVSEPDPAIENRPPADPAPREPASAAPRHPAPPQTPPVQTAPPGPRPVPAGITPAAETRETSPIPEPPPAAPSGMEFRVEAASAVWVQVACDGEDRMNRSLQAGEGQTLRCLSLIRISATDAGAVRLFVNGVRCVPIGDPGTRVEGFAIRSEDYRAICPPGGASSHGRR